MEQAEEVRCERCHKLLAKKVDGRLEIANGTHGGTRIYGAKAVVLQCPRCGYSVDMVVAGT